LKKGISVEERRVEERRKAGWIGGSVAVTGNVTAAGDLVIDGKVDGTIELGDHNLTIGETAAVVADLVAKDVKVKGNVLGSGRVELKKNGEVEGDITAPRFMMEEGAVLSGKVDSGHKK
jgi:cytoskeletal protein CcmA (bactofilin family)